MNKVPLQLRLLLNIIVFSLPIIVLTVLMFKSETVNIEFGKKEELGSRLLQPYEQLFAKVTTAKLTRRDINPSQEFDELKKVYNEIGPDLLFSSEQLAARNREVASLDYLTQQIAQKNGEKPKTQLKWESPI